MALVRLAPCLYVSQGQLQKQDSLVLFREQYPMALVRVAPCLYVSQGQKPGRILDL